MFSELFNFEFFFSKENFSEFLFFWKNVSCKFYAFPEKTFGKKTYINNFSLKKKSKTNLFGFFVPFDALVHC